MEDFDDHSLQESSIDIIENVSDIVPNHFRVKPVQRLFFINALLKKCLICFSKHFLNKSLERKSVISLTFCKKQDFLRKKKTLFVLFFLKGLLKQTQL